MGNKPTRRRYKQANELRALAFIRGSTAFDFPPVSQSAVDAALSAHSREPAVETPPPPVYSALVLALLDYGSGNLRSVEKALRKVGADVRVITGPDGLKDARAAVLPGVGAFDDCITALQRQELLEGVKTFIGSGRPFLGICVGYQALFEKSEEFNSCAAGLSLFAGKVVRFPSKPGLKVPQIGWNQLQIRRPDCPLYRGIDEGSYVYFVHSFYPQPKDESVVATRTTYGETFSSSVWRDNVYATQFHPEKSQGVGLRLLRNFVELAAKG